MQARGDAPEARVALGELCEAYWTPVFRFLRREGRGEDESRELAQEFFARLLAGTGIDGVDPAKGRFRSYLLGALKHFLAEQRRNGLSIADMAVMVSHLLRVGFELVSPNAKLPSLAT